MEKTSIFKKLHTAGGASLAIALVYFLLCATVGSVILGAAMANISHMKTQKVNEGSYLAVMSAGQVIREQIQKAAGDWFLDHGEQDSRADEDARVEFKENLIREIISGAGAPGGAAQTSGALSRALYRVYLNCVEQDNRLRVPKDGDDKKRKGESLSLTFSLGAEDEIQMEPVKADITFTPDYVVMDSGDTQQLQVKMEASFYIDGGEQKKGQYFLNMSCNSVVYYTLEETVTEAEDSDDRGEGGEGGEREPEYLYNYESRAVISSDRPVFYGKKAGLIPDMGGEAD